VVQQLAGLDQGAAGEPVAREAAVLGRDHRAQGLEGVRSEPDHLRPGLAGCAGLFAVEAEEPAVGRAELRAFCFDRFSAPHAGAELGPVAGLGQQAKGVDHGEAVGVRLVVQPVKTALEKVEGPGRGRALGDGQLGRLDEQRGPGQPPRMKPEGGELLAGLGVLDQHPVSPGGQESELDERGEIKDPGEPLLRAGGPLGHGEEPALAGGDQAHPAVGFAERIGPDHNRVGRPSGHGSGFR
jgi:hypothetical protein